MVRLLPCGHLDRLAPGLERDGLAAVLVAAGADLLQVQVGDVRAEVGHAPGDLVVVADDHAGHPGEGVTGDVVLALLGDAAAVQAHLVPEGRQLRREVRVVGEQRLAGGGVLARDDPGVGADAVAVGAEQGGDVVQDVGEAGELALHARVGAGAGRRRPRRCLSRPRFRSRRPYRCREFRPPFRFRFRCRRRSRPFRRPRRYRWGSRTGRTCRWRGRRRPCRRWAGSGRPGSPGRGRRSRPGPGGWSAGSGRSRPACCRAGPRPWP